LELRLQCAPGVIFNCFFFHTNSPSQYKVAIIKLLAKSRALFYVLEFRALRDILSGNEVEWDDADEIEHVFKHEVSLRYLVQFFYVEIL